MDDKRRKIQERIEEIAPDAASIAVANYLGQPNLELGEDITEEILAALRKLPTTGRIRKETEQRVVKALTYLLEKVPLDDSRRPEIEQLLHNAVKRTPGMS